MKHGEITLYYKDGDMKHIACGGGNDLTFDKGKKSDLKGQVVKSITKEGTLEVFGNTARYQGIIKKGLTIPTKNQNYFLSGSLKPIQM